MAATSSTDSPIYDAGARQTLLAVARQSIHNGVFRGEALPIDSGAYPALLREPKGCFVTLHRGPDHALRGCVGSLQARGPLISEISRSAFHSAFRDPRFPKMSEQELDDLHIHISVLTEPEEMTFASEEELLAQLRPHVDGVILKEGQRLGTFLPEVWDRFPEPADFLTQLRLKAGLPRNHWSSTLIAERYTTESFS